MRELTFGRLQTLFVKLTPPVMVEGTPSVLNLCLNHEDRAVYYTEHHADQPFCRSEPVLISGIYQSSNVLRGAEAWPMTLGLTLFTTTSSRLTTTLLHDVVDGWYSEVAHIILRPLSTCMCRRVALQSLQCLEHRGRTRASMPPTKHLRESCPEHHHRG